ncbi:Na+/H+ antiporter [Adlercreutzia murintestinalis]|uniref:Na+/H+ antiporter n=1 Tax=Adlercreutzia murintestinalis TaxID=2941325 RepID=UPI00203F0743|nr:Na+/H+ antiporter [Adlercreutzia murintestinalis]
METLTLVLFLTLGVLLSAVIDQIVPRVSLPLIQIGLGVVIAIFASSTITVELEPDLFLVLFIAPLLYIEAKNADRLALWINKGPILALAIGLVVVTAVIIGIALHSLVPSISVAAALALGAALGPTDAVAVTSLSKQISIPERQWGILRGELLLNDASGIVMFQFALGAAVTGTFNVAEAGIDFLIEFFGGLVAGAVLGYAFNLILRKIRDLGVENATFHVLYELCVPFIVYLLAQALHVSGIIAVVVAGLLNVVAPRTSSPSIARMNIVSSNVWQVLSFALNGIVFILLGTQLPASMRYAWSDQTVSNFTLIGYIFLITGILVGVRFIWCLCMEWWHARHPGHNGGEKKQFGSQSVRDALIVTLCGAKGTITLSILFTIPIFMATGQRFPERNLIIFIGCGVILITLLLATFVVPLVAPKRERKQSEIDARQNYFEVLSDILRTVIEELTAQQTRANRRSTRVVIRAYQDRLAAAKDMSDQDDGPFTELRLQALTWEQERTMTMIEQGIVDHDVGYEFLGRLERMERLTEHRSGHRFDLRRFLSHLRILLVRTRLALIRQLPDSQLTDMGEKMRRLQEDTARYVVDILRAEMAEGNVATEDASKLIMEYEASISALTSSRTSVTTSIKIADESDDIRRMAYYMELEQIQKMYEEERINRQEARTMRDNVSLMMMDLDDTL